MYAVYDYPVRYSPYHRTVIIDDIGGRTRTRYGKNSAGSLAKLLTTSMEQSHCNVPDTFDRAMILKGPEGQKLADLCMRA